MQTSCAQCGKSYQIDTSFIQGEKAWFTCKGCGERVVVENPAANNGSFSTARTTPSQPAKPVAAAAPPATTQAETMKAAVDQATSSIAKTRGKFGLRVKMMLLFLVVPLALMGISSTVYLQQLDRLSSVITSESSSVVTDLAEQIIANSAASVAAQVKLYLDNRPGMTGPELSRDEALKAIAIQPVGKTGYTALYELPDENGVWRTWAHVNPKIIGIDMSKLEKPLGKNFPGFWAIYTGVKGGKESRGYYTWQDKDGALRDKFMVSVPVPGTRYVIASTTYLDEFTQPVKELEAKAGQITEQTTQFTVLALVITLVLVGIIVTSYGIKLTGKIRELTNHAERISAGDLDSKVEVSSKDEIGELAHAISLMQTSIRLSIDRLRRRG
ncbi:MAG: hypothetical protein Kow006_14320 [Gammaproteobacteria bacterium]